MNKQLLVTLISLSIFGYGCRKGGRCETPLNVNQSEAVVTFKDINSGNYLYREVGPVYNIDSLKILDENNQSLILLKDLDLIPNSSSRYWSVSFGPIYNTQTDAESFNSELCKDYVVKYSYNETDTLKICFKSKKTRCGSVFETLKVYQKEKLIGTETNNTGILVTILKD